MPCTMITVFDDAQRAHDPQMFLSSGAPRPCPEKPARIDALLGAVRQMGAPVVRPPDAGLAPIAAVHPHRYLTFLQGIHTRWTRIEGASAEVIPNIHPANRTDGYPKSAVGQAGLNDADKEVISPTLAALALNQNAIVLLSGFHDPSGDPTRNAELAKGRAMAVRDALVAAGVAGERIKFRKPESTVGTGSAEEGRRVEIRVQ